MVEYARNFFIAVFLGCLLFGLFIIGTNSANAQEEFNSDTPSYSVVEKSIKDQYNKNR